MSQSILVVVWITISSSPDSSSTDDGDDRHHGHKYAPPPKHPHDTPFAERLMNSVDRLCHKFSQYRRILSVIENIE